VKDIITDKKTDKPISRQADRKKNRHEHIQTKRLNVEKATQRLTFLKIDDLINDFFDVNIQNMFV
jgi:hypothetical protein